MIFAIIAAVITLLLLIVVCLPITVNFALDDGFSLSVKYAGFTVFDTDKPKRTVSKNKEAAENTHHTEDVKKENFLKSKYKELGFFESVKYFSGIISIILHSVKRLLAKLKFDKFCLQLSVASDNAADTAIRYGAVCAAVYPVISLLESSCEFKTRSISVNADFEHISSELKIRFRVTARLVYALTIAVCALFKYLKIKKDSEENGRKQH